MNEKNGGIFPCNFWNDDRYRKIVWQHGRRKTTKKKGYEINKTERKREDEIKKTVSVTGFINDAIYPFRNNEGLLICW